MLKAKERQVPGVSSSWILRMGVHPCRGQNALSSAARKLLLTSQELSLVSALCGWMWRSDVFVLEVSLYYPSGVGH